MNHRAPEDLVTDAMHSVLQNPFFWYPKAQRPRSRPVNLHSMIKTKRNISWLRAVTESGNSCSSSVRRLKKHGLSHLNRALGSAITLAFGVAAIVVLSTCAHTSAAETVTITLTVTELWRQRNFNANCDNKLQARLSLRPSTESVTPKTQDTPRRHAGFWTNTHNFA